MIYVDLLSTQNLLCVIQSLYHSTDYLFRVEYLNVMPLYTFRQQLNPRHSIRILQLNATKKFAKAIVQWVTKRRAS